MGRKRQQPEVSEEVEILFGEVESFVSSLLARSKPPLKVQIEKDFRGKPVLSVRVRAEEVDFEQMDTLRYPE